MKPSLTGPGLRLGGGAHLDGAGDRPLRGAVADRLQAAARLRAPPLHRPAPVRHPPHDPGAITTGTSSASSSRRPARPSRSRSTPGWPRSSTSPRAPAAPSCSPSTAARSRWPATATGWPRRSAEPVCRTGACGTGCAIAAITGHRSLSEIERYTRAATKCGSRAQPSASRRWQTQRQRLANQPKKRVTSEGDCAGWRSQGDCAEPDFSNT